MNVCCYFVVCSVYTFLFLQSNEGKYANVMTIRSSIDEAGKHHVTHKIRNLKTGGSSTLLSERVTGQRVTTVFKA